MKTREEIAEFISQCNVQEILYQLHLGVKDANGDECYIPQAYFGNTMAKDCGYKSMKQMKRIGNTLNLHNDVDEIVTGAKGVWEEVKQFH